MSSSETRSGLIDAAARRPVAGRMYQRFAIKCADLPGGFDLVLPDGSVQRFGNGTKAFNLVVNDSRTLQAFATLDQNTVAESYFAGDFDIEGDMLSALRIRAALGDRHPLLAVWRTIQPLLLG